MQRRFMITITPVNGTTTDIMGTTRTITLPDSFEDYRLVGITRNVLQSGLDWLKKELDSDENVQRLLKSVPCEGVDDPEPPKRWTCSNFLCSNPATVPSGVLKFCQRCYDNIQVMKGELPDAIQYQRPKDAESAGPSEGTINEGYKAIQEALDESGT